MLNIIDTVRQNHALEHATMHILSRRHPYLRLAGRSTVGGFLIYGPVGTQDVAAAATEALARLQQGEAYLAVHPRCGTNLAVTAVMAGGAAFGVGAIGRSKSRLDRLPLALTAATLAAVLAQPLAHKLQERVTTSPELDGAFIAEVSRIERGRFIIHKVTVGRG